MTAAGSPLRVPGATALLDRADVDLGRLSGPRALMIGAPDRLGRFTEDGLPEVIAANKARLWRSTCSVLAARERSTGSGRCWSERTGSCRTATSFWD